MSLENNDREMITLRDEIRQLETQCEDKQTDIERLETLQSDSVITIRYTLSAAAAAACMSEPS